MRSKAAAYGRVFGLAGIHKISSDRQFDSFNALLSHPHLFCLLQGISSPWLGKEIEKELFDSFDNDSIPVDS